MFITINMQSATKIWELKRGMTRIQLKKKKKIPKGLEMLIIKLLILQ